MKPALFAIAATLLLLHPAAANQPTEIQTQLGTAHALLKQGLSPAAREIYAHIATDRASSSHERSEAQVWLGHVLRDEGKLDAAVEAYSKAIFIPEAHPRNLCEAHVWIGQIHFTRGDYKKARREFTAALNLPDPGPDHIRFAKERLAQIEQIRKGRRAERQMEEWFAKLEKPDARDAGKQLGTATAFAINTFGPDVRVMPKVLQRLAKLAANDSPDALKAWFKAVPSSPEWGPLKSELAMHVYDLLPKKDYAANARWIGELTGTQYYIRAISNFAADYAEADPEAAMNWVSTTKPKPDINIVIGVIEIVRAWSVKDMAGLERWLEAHRDTPVFNQATRDLAVIYADSNRDLAKKWGEQNNDPKRRAFIDKLLSKPPKQQN